LNRTQGGDINNETTGEITSDLENPCSERVTDSTNINARSIE